MRRVPFILLIYVLLVCGLLLFKAWAGEVPRVAGEKGTSPYLHLVSDCLIYTFKADFVTAVGAVPEGVPVAGGGQRYTLELQVGERFYQFCWSERAPRDEALAMVETALGGK
jgi:hypothetical protein